MKKRKKLGAERLSEFFRQFSVLVESGLSIPETLEIMQQDDTDREFCLACRKLGAFMTEGKTVGDAMHDKRMNDCLPPILFSAIFKLLKVLPDTELDAC